jgi:predicted amidohydrolase
VRESSTTYTLLMKPLFLAIAFAASLAAQSLPFHQTAFGAADAGRGGWTAWSPRPEIAPRAYIDDVHSRSGHGALALSGQSNPAVFGGWERALTGIQPGAWYHFRASYRAEGLDYAPHQVVSRLDWIDRAGKRVGQPEYSWETNLDRDWTTVALDAKAPERAVTVKIQLLLVNAPRATVWWDEVLLEPAQAPAARNVTVASVNLYPKNSRDPVGEFLAVLERSMPQGVDIALLPEGITVVGTGKSYAEVAEPIPGPATARLGEFARRKKTWVVAGLYEREGQAVYNTAVLIDREGRVAGRYRKVYIPREEFEGGITPGSDYPVFHTDFGTIGLMICWDSQYPDPARALALRGAEMILMPIWGGNETLSKARAIENHLFIAAAGYDHPTYILDPDGKAVAQAPERATIATATLDLNRRYPDPWLGDMRARFMKELRFDAPVDPPGRR